MTGNKVVPTASVTPARVRLFQPTQRPTLRQGEWMETTWGRCRVFGRLGQRHADILEAVLFCAERRVDEDGGLIKLLVDPARVRQVMGETRSKRGHMNRYSLEQCWTLLRELRACTIELDTPERRLAGGLVDTVEETKRESRVNPLTGADRHLWTVRLGDAWSELMRLDPPLRYDPTPIARLKYGVSQAVARHILTHRDDPAGGGWTLDWLIEAVCGALAGQALRDSRRRLRSDAAGLLAAGIVLECERARRLQHRR